MKRNDKEVLIQTLSSDNNVKNVTLHLDACVLKTSRKCTKLTTESNHSFKQQMTSGLHFGGACELEELDDGGMSGRAKAFGSGFGWKGLAAAAGAEGCWGDAPPNPDGFG